MRLAVSDLRVRVSGTSGEGVSEDVGLFTPMKHPVVLNLTLNAEHGSTDTKDNLSHTDGGDFNNGNNNISDNSDYINKAENHSSKMAHQENSNHGNISHDHNLNQNHNTGSWKSVVSTHAEFSLEVVSPASPVGSRVIWSFSLDDVIVMSRTTEEWNVNVSLTIAGCYKVTVKAFNPTNWASFCTHILVQDPVGELLLNVPSVITANQKHSVSFSVTAGSNVTVSLLVNATVLYRNSSHTTGEEATVILLFDHAGVVVVELRAENRVSSQNKSVRVSVEGNRKPSPQVRANPTWQPPTSQSPVHSLADNGEEVSRINTH